MTFGEQVLSFYKNLDIKAQLPKGVVVLNPYHDDEAFSYCSQFYNKFYGDSNERTIIFGINPGRHGGGMTGIPFTDPIKLENYCGIPNPFIKKPELSADFIYTMIAAYGGPEKFYGQFFFQCSQPFRIYNGRKEFKLLRYQGSANCLEGLYCKFNDATVVVWSQKNRMFLFRRRREF